MCRFRPGGATLLKLLLYIYCTFANKNLPVPMDSMDALAEDHINDVMSNAVALVTGLIAYWYKNWWIDPSGAILISVIIIYRWYDIILDQVKVWNDNRLTPRIQYNRFYCFDIRKLWDTPRRRIL